MAPLQSRLHERYEGEGAEREKTGGREEGGERSKREEERRITITRRPFSFPSFHPAERLFLTIKLNDDDVRPSSRGGLCRGEGDPHGDQKQAKSAAKGASVRN